LQRTLVITDKDTKRGAAEMGTLLFLFKNYGMKKKTIKILRRWEKSMLLWIIIMILCNICSRIHAQVAFHTTLGGDLSGIANGFVGAEFQASNVAVTTSWRPFSIGEKMYTDGFSLGTKFYLYAFRTTPYFSSTIITHGKYNISDVTGEAKRSMELLLGLRAYPFQMNDNIIERLSFDVATGIDIGEHKTIPVVNITMNFTLFKW